MKAFGCLISVIIFLCGCGIQPVSVIPDKTWDELDPYKNAAWEMNAEKIRQLCEKKENREILIKFLYEELKALKISYKDQIRLATIMVCLQKEATGDDEKKEIDRLISFGDRHIDFYGLSLSVLPPYMRTSLEVFKHNLTLVGHFVDPDGGGKRKYSIQELFLDKLRSATGQDFGSSYEQWADWWDTKGQFMDFDYDRSIYVQSRQQRR